MSKVENLSNQEILLELKRYKKGFNLVMEHFDKWDNDTRQDVHKQLLKIDL